MKRKNQIVYKYHSDYEIISMIIKYSNRKGKIIKYLEKCKVTIKYSPKSVWEEPAKHRKKFLKKEAKLNLEKNIISNYIIHIFLQCLPQTIYP